MAWKNFPIEMWWQHDDEALVNVRLRSCDEIPVRTVV
jgi:hypothetical protein